MGRFWAVSGPMLHRRRNMVQRVDSMAVILRNENLSPFPYFFLDRFRAVRPDSATVNLFNSLDGSKIPRFRAGGGIGTAARYQGTAARARYRAPGSGFPSSPGPSNPTREPRARAGMLESIPACMESRAVSGPVTLPNLRIVHRGPSPAALRAKKRAVRFPQRPGTRAAIGPQGRLTLCVLACCDDCLQAPIARAMGS